MSGGKATSKFKRLFGHSEAGTQREALNEEMRVTIGALQETLRCASVLGHLVDMLNSCISREEAYEVIDLAARSMFAAGGSVSAFDASKNQLETKCAWGNFTRDH